MKVLLSFLACGVAAGTVCDDYCTAQETNCVGANVITFDADCETDCAAFTLGEDGDTGADTAYCRLYHAGAPAATDPALHCPHASPSGGGVCTVCAEYCALVAENCVGDNAITFDADCETDCAAYTLGEDGDTGADTAHCRLYHAGAPAATDPALHCPHASPSGGGVCIESLLDGAGGIACAAATAAIAASIAGTL
jgi:hypothetical protein